MSLHGLLSVTIGVPNVDETAAYYTDFGLTPGKDGWFSTADAGHQPQLPAGNGGAEPAVHPRGEPEVGVVSGGLIHVRHTDGDR